MRKTTVSEKEVMEYLNFLRESGATNMFGATPYVIEEFGLEKSEARRILSLWMSNFNSAGDYTEVKD